MNRLIRPEYRARSDSKKKGVADLTRRTGDGNSNALLHNNASRFSGGIFRGQYLVGNHPQKQAIYGPVGVHSC
jgi:hypothetical protein